ncbi:hypothetical protein R3J32_04445 [Xylella fastidiosa subsp. multiplex]|uniref:hypothetical protein n=1 Tax=Xylella fastidiosa TaxID=2371 RepID=UPI0035D50802
MGVPKVTALSLLRMRSFDRCNTPSSFIGLFGASAVIASFGQRSGWLLPEQLL